MTALSLKILVSLCAASLSIDVLGAVEPATIHQAVQEGNHAAVELFITRDPTSVYKQDKTDKTPLHIAANRGDIAIARLLLKNNAKVNARDDIGDTPLHEAAWHGHTEVACLLMANGARANKYNFVGNRAVDYAEMHNNQTMMSLLQHWPRLWQQYCAARLAFCAALHPIVGAGSQANMLTQPLVREIFEQYVRPESFVLSNSTAPQTSQSMVTTAGSFLTMRHAKIAIPATIIAALGIWRLCH